MLATSCRLSYPNVFYEPRRLGDALPTLLSRYSDNSFVSSDSDYWFLLTAREKEIQLHFMHELAEKLQVNLSTARAPFPLRWNFQTLLFIQCQNAKHAL